MRAKDLRASDLARLVWGEHPNGSARNRDRISVYINGKALPERENLEAIARALDVEPEELLPSAKPIGGEPEMQIVLIPHDPAHAVFKCNKRMSLVLACRLAALVAEEDELIRTGKKPQSQSAGGSFADLQPDEELAATNKMRRFSNPIGSAQRIVENVGLGSPSGKTSGTRSSWTRPRSLGTSPPPNRVHQGRSKGCPNPL